MQDTLTNAMPLNIRATLTNEKPPRFLAHTQGTVPHGQGGRGEREGPVVPWLPGHGDGGPGPEGGNKRAGGGGQRMTPHTALTLECIPSYCTTLATAGRPANTKQKPSGGSRSILIQLHFLALGEIRGGAGSFLGLKIWAPPRWWREKYYLDFGGVS